MSEAPSQLITTHENADLDALASAIAMQKLVGPGAVIAVGRRVSPTVRNFLALHRDHFVVAHANQLDLARVTELYVTDVRRRSRLEHVSAVLERRAADPESVHLELWDHHPDHEDDLKGDFDNVEALGAVTTLFVEEIRSRNIRLDIEAATLFALAIHADTGAFSYATTRARDAEAFAWLLAQGARTSVLATYLQPPLSPVQQSVLASMLQDLERHSVSGVDVGIVRLSPERMPEGLAQVVGEAAALMDVPVIFAVVHGKRRVALVGRSRSPEVDVGQVLGLLGGGGHPGAGAAVVRGDAGVDEVADRLLSLLFANAGGGLRVRQVMSSPAFVLPPEMPLTHAAFQLAQWGIRGAPVMKDDRIVGVISQRDITKARRDDRMKLPVSSCMAGELVAVDLDAPIDVAIARMTQHDIGRLPVLEGERLVGVVTRTDALRLLYGQAGASSFPMRSAHPDPVIAKLPRSRPSHADPELEE